MTVPASWLSRDSTRAESAGESVLSPCHLESSWWACLRSLRSRAAWIAGQLALNVVVDAGFALVELSGGGVCTGVVGAAGLARPYQSGTAGTTPGAGAAGADERNGFCAVDC